MIFEVLSNERRRDVCRHLAEEGETTLGSMAESIAAAENDTTQEALSSTQRKRVYVGLYQIHLPKMADLDIIAFDEDRKTIRPGEHFDAVYDSLAIIETRNSTTGTGALRKTRTSLLSNAKSAFSRFRP